MRTVDPELWCKKLNKGASGSTAKNLGHCGPIELRLRASFKDALGEFWRNAITPRVQNEDDVDARKNTKWCYGLLRMSLVVWALSSMAYMITDFSSRPPLQFNRRNKQGNSVVVPFPAIAICSNAIITNSALDAYTKYLAKKKYYNTSYSYAMIRSNLMKFGNLVTLSEPEPDMEFMQFVFEVDPDFNVTRVMQMFAPRCTDILRRCGWQGHTVNCARLFAERPTPFGFCCVFNSRYHPADLSHPAQTLRLLGQNYGLIVIVHENPDEAGVSRRPTGGFDVLMFDGRQYPLLESGLVRHLLPSRNESVHFPLRAHAHLASHTLSSYTEEWVLTFDGRQYPLLESGLARHLLPSRNESVHFPLRAHAHLASHTLSSYTEEWVLTFDGRQYPLLESGLVRHLLPSRNESVHFPLRAHAHLASHTLSSYTEEWVLIFDVSQYPLLESGLVRHLLPSRNESVHFPLRAHAHLASHTLSSYTEEWRRCRLQQLDGPSRDEYSSYTWCLTECRRRTVEALCDCIPFTLMANDTETTCTPEHLTCLVKHREKLLYYYPGEGTNPRLDKERQDSQDCENCVPDCARQWHTTVPYHTRLHNPKKLSKIKFPVSANGKGIINMTVLRFYYNSLHQMEYKVEINIRWYEAFATISCQARLLVGLSVITLSELLFFLTIRWAHHFIRRTRRETTRQNSALPMFTQ